MEIDYLWLGQTVLGALLGSGITGWLFKATYQNKLDKKLEEAKANLTVYVMQQQIKFSKFHDKQFDAICEVYSETYSLSFDMSTIVDHKFYDSNANFKMLHTASEKLENTREKLFKYSIYFDQNIYEKIEKSLLQYAQILLTITNLYTSDDKTELSDSQNKDLEKKLEESRKLIESARTLMEEKINPAIQQNS